MLKEIGTILTLLSALGIVIFLAYITTIFVGKKTGGYFSNPSVKLLERVNIGYQLNITIIEIHNKVYVLAIFNKNLQVVDILDKEEWHRCKEEIISRHLSNTSADSYNSLKQMKGKLSNILNKGFFKESNYKSKNEGDKND